MFMPREWYSRTTMAIPGIRIWEHVLMFFAVTVGIRGFLGESMAYVALGHFVPLYFAVMIIAPLLFEAGQFMYPPTGLVVSIGALLLLSMSSFAIFAGLAVAMGTILFSGYATSLTFAVGGLLRAIQMFVHLDRLQRITTQMRKEQDDFRAINISSGSGSNT